MPRTRLSAAFFPVLTMVAVTAYAGGAAIDFGATELGQIKTGCVVVPGPGTVNTLNTSPPFFIRGIRIAPASLGIDACDNVPNQTTPTTLPRTLGPNQELVFDIDLVPIELGLEDDVVRLNGTPVVDLSANIVTAPACNPSAPGLCLNDDRFKVRTHWRTVFGTRNAATAVPFMTDDSGLFYFFNPDNWEVLIKVLDACTLDPPRYWVFSAATTNVEYTITVTDTQEQEAVRYFKAQGPPAPAITDTAAFATCP